MNRIKILLFIACCAGLMYGLFRETPPPELFEQSDKFGHLSGFAAMTLAGLWCLPRRGFLIFMIILLGLALSAEFLQAEFLPHRHFSIEDLYANLAGILSILSLWLIWLLCKYLYLRTEFKPIQTSGKRP